MRKNSRQQARALALVVSAILLACSSHSADSTKDGGGEDNGGPGID